MYILTGVWYHTAKGKTIFWDMAEWLAHWSDQWVAEVVSEVWAPDSNLTSSVSWGIPYKIDI